MLISFIHTAFETQRELFYVKMGERKIALDYNELKISILRIFSGGGRMDSEAIASKLAAGGVMIEIHAARMALLRYFKQGLLNRKRASGVFSYELTERGRRRLEWLETASRREGASGGRILHTPEG
jgi:repressor of nif and glnA expression